MKPQCPNSGFSDSKQYIWYSLRAGYAELEEPIANWAKRMGYHSKTRAVSVLVGKRYGGPLAWPEVVALHR